MIRSARALRGIVGALAATALAAAPAHAQVAWTDWTSYSGNNSATGTLMFGSTPIGVSYSGQYDFVQTACGTNYWSPNVYTGTGVPNAPSDCDIVAIGQGGAKTITFSQAVVNPLIALVSWNGQPPLTFNGPIEVVSQGNGYWGNGSISASGDVLNVSGEAHGTVRLLGSYTQITFTDVTEGWHGFTIGATAVAPPMSAVPEPSTYVLTATGLLGLVAAARRRRSA